MKFKVQFTAHANVRTTPIFSKYRPGWTAPLKPHQNSGALVFDDIKMIWPGDTHICEVHPFQPQYWTDVRQNDVLKCMEGSREVGEATVLEIIQDVPVV